MSQTDRVHGGSHGIDADLDDMDATGSRIAALGWALVEEAADGHAVLVDADLLQSAVLSPTSFARFEADLLHALDGPGGLAATAVRLSAAGTLMRTRARAYQATDEALEMVEDVRQHAQGQLAGLGLAVNPVGAAGIVALLLWRDGAVEDPEGWLVAHPDLLEETVASAPGLVDLGLPGFGFPAGVEQASALLGLLYVQGAAEPTTAGPEVTAAPDDLADAMQVLDEAADHEDQFRIEQVGSGEAARYNVYLPGTKAFDAPWAQSGLVQNLGTNFAGVAGAENAYVESVLVALRRLQRTGDLSAGAEINLIGHSQGGIVAARLAERLSAPGNGEGVEVRSVVTAGSPVDHVDLPDSVRMISLVNEYDIVPRLDGEDYDDRSNHTTIVREVQTGSVVGNHDLTRLYKPMSRDLVLSEDPRIRAALAPLEDFTPGGESRTWRFQMHRD